jgi:uncharacterized protein YndB with AHSA1/START domain
VAAGILMVVQGAGHTLVGTPTSFTELSQQAVWFAAAGLAMVFLGLLNLCSAPTASRPRAWSLLAANALWAILVSGLLVTSQSARVIAAAVLAAMALVGSVGTHSHRTMSDILLDLPVKSTVDRVFERVSTPQGLDTWWTKEASGRPEAGAVFSLGFGPEHRWRAKVTRCVPDAEFELEITHADADWVGTRVGFRLTPRGAVTWLRFHHTGWPDANEHYRVSCSCWAMYLRVLRRSLEHGESVPYEERLDA